MRRRQPPADQPTPPNDWLSRADEERTHRDARWRQHKATLGKQAAVRAAWRPEIENMNRPAQHVLRGVRDRD